MPKKLFLIKLIHTLIFFFISACLIYILYAAISKTYDRYLVIALSAVFIEGVALLLNHFQCPLTSLAKKYGDEKGSVADIFLPAWCARNIFLISAVLFVVELVLLGFGYFMK